MMEKKPWLDQYDRGVPRTLRPYPAHTLLEVVSDAARKRPGNTALLFQGARFRWVSTQEK